MRACPPRQVAHRDRERVGLVGEPRLHPEESARGADHLLFLGAAVAREGALHLRRRVLEDGQAGATRCRQRDPARLAERGERPQKAVSIATASIPPSSSSCES